MFKRAPKELALTLLNRSQCSVKVAAVLVDSYGVFSWGWNSSGPSGFGLCAERHAIKRANRWRLPDSEIFIAGMRVRNHSFVEAKPCEKCLAVILKCKIKVIHYYDKGEWKTLIL